MSLGKDFAVLMLFVSLLAGCAWTARPVIDQGEATAGGMSQEPLENLKNESQPQNGEAETQLKLEVQNTPDANAEIATQSLLAPEDFGNYHALVIGNIHYAHLPPLRTVAADVKSVTHLLNEKYGFKTNTLIDATRHQVLAEIDKLRAKLTGAHPLVL